VDIGNLREALGATARALSSIPRHSAPPTSGTFARGMRTRLIKPAPSGSVICAATQTARGRLRRQVPCVGDDEDSGFRFRIRGRSASRIVAAENITGTVDDFASGRKNQNWAADETRHAVFSSLHARGCNQQRMKGRDYADTPRMYTSSRPIFIRAICVIRGLLFSVWLRRRQRWLA